MAVFYIPAQALTNNEFKKAADVFVSPDGSRCGTRFRLTSIPSAPVPWIRSMRSPIPRVGRK